MRHRKVPLHFLLIGLALILSACAPYQPGEIKTSDLLAHAQTVEDNEFKISAYAPSAKESREITGVPITSKGILPLWLEIENKSSEKPYIFPIRSLTPDYYTAHEAAYISRIRPGTRLLKGFVPPFKSLGILAAPIDYFFVHPANTAMEAQFEAMDWDSAPLRRGSKHSGFIFVPFEMGTKHLKLDLFGTDDIKSYDLDVVVPGIDRDFEKRDFENLYKEKDLIPLETDEELKQYLDSLPCCVTNLWKTQEGDPLNLVVIGDLDEVLSAFAGAKWTETEIITLRTLWKMAGAFFSNKPYEYSPVSPLYFEGRSHDIALQKARSSIHERMHLRLWLTPARFHSKPVWAGGVSRDIGVRLTKHSWSFTTHKIDSDIDESREYTIADIYFADRLVRYGFIKGSKEASIDSPAKNLTGDDYYTDGKRLVIQVSKLRLKDEPVPFSWNERLSQ